jgi:hypothetical protein
MIPKDARFQANMANFVESCVIPNIEINHKYTYRDIFESKDIARFFFNPSFSPSETRTMFYGTWLIKSPFMVITYFG